MSFVTHLQCISCKKEYAPNMLDYTCPACGSLKGTCEVFYDYEKIKPQLNRKTLAANPKFTHWRYLPILPVDRPEYIQPLAVGWTPLYKATALEDIWGIKNIFVKDDGRNPSASYKDRASAVGIVKALENKATVVTAASTGNAAASWSAFTTLAKLKTVIFVPENAPKAKIAQLLLFGATVLKVKGSYDDAFDLCAQAALKWGWYNRSTAINPYLGEGKKTGALEVCEQLDWQVPDYVFVAVGDGCIYQGLWKGFKDFYRLGLIDRLPKLIGVQAEGSAPLVHAWQANKFTCEPVIAQTVADSISVGIPRDQVKALIAAKESNGAFITVSDDEIINAIALLAKNVGVMAEPAGSAAMAGLKKMIHSGEIKANDTCVVLVTGNGLKDIDSVLKAVEQQPLLVENSLDDVAIKLEQLH